MDTKTPRESLVLEKRETGLPPTTNRGSRPSCSSSSEEEETLSFTSSFSLSPETPSFGIVVTAEGADMREKDHLEDTTTAMARGLPISEKQVNRISDNSRTVTLSHSASLPARLGEHLHHERKPSTIFESYCNNEDEEDETNIDPNSSTLKTRGPLTIDASTSSGEEDDSPEHHNFELFPNGVLSASSSVPVRKSFSSPSLLSVSTPSTADPTAASLRRTTPRRRGNSTASEDPPPEFEYQYRITKILHSISNVLFQRRSRNTPSTSQPSATILGFWALLLVTGSNYVLTPLRDAIALQLGVKHIPMLTLVSTLLAFGSSVPIGWLFEAPDPTRRKMWKRMGLTRGETQGTSLALFYRCFAILLLSYAVGFTLVNVLVASNEDNAAETTVTTTSSLWALAGQFLYVAFFLVVHLMKLHSLSLVWGVTTEAMEYEDVARKKNTSQNMTANPPKTRIERLAFVGFGGTIGGILGSGVASTMAQTLRLPGLLVLSAILLEVSAVLSIELGRIMQKHWVEQQQLFASTNDLTSLDASMKRVGSLGSMKRVASGNSLNRIRSHDSLSGLSRTQQHASSGSLQNLGNSGGNAANTSPVADDSFFQRLIRGISTILRSRLLMAIFTYNALYASTTVLLSFQRAALVAGRSETSNTEKDTAFLARVNMASSLAVLALQASGLGAWVAHCCGPARTLSLMPAIRLVGVLALAWWHRVSGGSPPNLMVFLLLDECCKIMNLSVAKPVRESLWRGLSNEARYEAKPIVDTLANRWGGGSAAFLVSFLHKTLDFVAIFTGSSVGGSQGDITGGSRTLFGFPPVLCLCMIIASWWTVVSVDLGQIRKRIDAELKKQE